MWERKSKKQKMSRDASEGRSTLIGPKERLRIVKRKKRRSENQREKYLGVKNCETNTSYTKWERAKLIYSTIGPVGPVPSLKISHVSTLTFTTNGVSVGKKISALFHLSSLSPQPHCSWGLHGQKLQTCKPTKQPPPQKNPETHGA